MAEINITDVTNEDNTRFLDIILRKHESIIQGEFNKGNIAQSDYSSAFINGYQATLQQAFQFILNKQQSDKQAELLAAQVSKTGVEENLVTAQIQLTNTQKTKGDSEIAILAQELINLTTAKTKMDKEISILDSQRLNIDSETTLNTTRNTNLGKEGLRIDKEVDVLSEDILVKKAQVTQMSTENTRITAQKNLIVQQEANALLERDSITAQKDLVISQKAKVDADILNIPKQGSQLDAQTALLGQQLTNAVTDNATQLKQQTKIDGEVALLSVRKFAEEAQYLDTVDGNAVVGVIGKKKALYDAQITGFTNDYDVKLRNLKANVFSVMRGTDDALVPAANIYDDI